MVLQHNMAKATKNDEWITSDEVIDPEPTNSKILSTFLQL